MNALTISHGPTIRALHHEAQALAASAIDRALEAGRLLAEVKAALPHGEFGAWVQDECGFTDRTARRYMQLHQHREMLPAGSSMKAALAHLKTDTVSDMPKLQLLTWPSEKIRAALGPWPDAMASAFTVLRFSGMDDTAIACRTGFDIETVGATLGDGRSSREGMPDAYYSEFERARLFWEWKSHSGAVRFAQNEFPAQAATHSILADRALSSWQRLHSDFDAVCALIAWDDFRVCVAIDSPHGRGTDAQLKFWAKAYQEASHERT